MTSACKLLLCTSVVIVSGLMLTPAAGAESTQSFAGEPGVYEPLRLVDAGSTLEERAAELARRAAERQAHVAAFVEGDS